jgi:hypothetical protein
LKLRYWKFEAVEKEKPELMLKVASNKKLELTLAIRKPLSPKKSRVLLARLVFREVDRLEAGK